MNKFCQFFLILSVLAGQSIAQVITEPEFFTADESVRIIYDATLGTSALQGASKVYMHAGAILESSTSTTWENVVGNWGEDDGVGEMTKVAGQSDKWEITITPRSYFSVASGTAIYRLGMVFRNEGTKEGKNDSNGDFFIEVSQGGLDVRLDSPVDDPHFVDQNGQIIITAFANEAADYTLTIGSIVVNTQNSIKDYSFAHVATEAQGSTVNVVLSATNGTDTKDFTFNYFVRTNTESLPRPAGIVDGINYGADPTKAILSLLAPNNSSVYIVGDFTNWEIDPAYLMKKDGENYWLEVTGLTPGQEHVFQYLVDENIWVPDPYSDKILDPDDQWITSTTYPNLMTYPSEALRDRWEFNRVSVLQTDQTPYTWNTTNFIKPPKEELIVYELLVRDFLGPDNMNYRSLIDTLDYLENLGINAIELMPVMEFNGNDSWGYNPTHMFAIDKAYGTKDDLKAFVDAAHGRGIAVILDMVMNQNNKPSPYLMMDFDYVNDKPSPTNNWFNVEAKHPYNVFYDINHESLYTKNWLDSINHYWLNEFKFDGYRFDLSKGFTQVFNTDVGLWGNYDISRINILKRMADKVWSHSPDAYVILEHFADNDEEKELSDYGMMLWGNAHGDYKNANLGNADGKSLGWHYYQSRNWTNNYLISYMESHDEERQMYDMINHGQSSGSYDAKDVSTALNRLKMSATFFFATPGPKMIWQFGEFGYDISINENGRTGVKPTKWEYLDDPIKNNLLKVYKEIIGLRNKYDVFTKGDFSWSPDGNFKSIHLSNADTSVVIVGNYGLTNGEINPAFTSTGTWYNFFKNEEIQVTNVNNPLFLKPGEFHIFTDKKLHVPEAGIIDPVTSIDKMEASQGLQVYPNPASSTLNIHLANQEYLNKPGTWVIIDVFGKEVLKGDRLNGASFRIDVSALSRGIYTFVLGENFNAGTVKFIKE